MRPSATPRRRLALALCVAWLLGVELLPDLHLAMHDRLAAHDHGAGPGGDGAPLVYVHLDPTWHSHGDGAHRHDGAAHHGAPGPASPARHGINAPDTGPPDHGTAPRHGAHSLAHRALAIASPPPAIVEPLPIARLEVPTAAVVARRVTVAPPPPPAARGPPRA